MLPLSTISTSAEHFDSHYGLRLAPQHSANIINMQFKHAALIALGLAVSNTMALPTAAGNSAALVAREDQAANAPAEANAPQEAQAPEQKQDWVDGLQLAGQIAGDIRDANNPYGRGPYGNNWNRGPYDNGPYNRGGYGYDGYRGPYGNAPYGRNPCKLRRSISVSNMIEMMLID